MTEPTPREKDWLRKILDDAAREVASWPEWKRREAKAMMDELAKPYQQFRRYPVTRDGTII
jgi:hypothetical protein